MKLNDVWGYGQLFAFSGLDGLTRYYDDFVATLRWKKGELRFELKEWVKVTFPLKGRVRFRAITGDMIDAEIEQGEFFLTYVSEDALIGYVPELPTFKGEKGLKHYLSWGRDVYATTYDRIGVAWEKTDRGYKIAILSGGFTYFGEYLQKKFGIDYVFANELEVDETGHLTGRYVGDIVDGHKKADLLRLIAQTEKVNLAQTIAVGDGANDLPMISEAGLGIAFHAKPKVVANARQSINTIGLDGVLYFLGFKDSQLGETGVLK